MPEECSLIVGGEGREGGLAKLPGAQRGEIQSLGDGSAVEQRESIPHEVPLLSLLFPMQRRQHSTFHGPVKDLGPPLARLAAVDGHPALVACDARPAFSSLHPLQAPRTVARPRTPAETRPSERPRAKRSPSLRSAPSAT